MSDEDLNKGKPEAEVAPEKKDTITADDTARVEPSASEKPMESPQIKAPENNADVAPASGEKVPVENSIADPAEPALKTKEEKLSDATETKAPEENKVEGDKKPDADSTQKTAAPESSEGAGSVKTDEDDDVVVEDIKGKARFDKDKIELLKKKYLTKENQLIGGVLLGGAILILIVYSMMNKDGPQGSILYGICSAYLEQQLAFPESVRHNAVDQYQRAVRIYYTAHGTFGEYRLETIECAFKRDPQYGLLVETIIFNHVRPITKKKPIKGKGRLYQVTEKNIDKFNKSGSVNAIIMGNPDLTLPVRKENLLENIK